MNVHCFIVGPCPSVNTQCKNGAFCFTNGKQETCFCQTGFSGPNCTHGNKVLGFKGNYWVEEFAKLLTCRYIYIVLFCNVTYFLYFFSISSHLDSAENITDVQHNGVSKFVICIFCIYKGKSDRKQKIK